MRTDQHYLNKFLYIIYIFLQIKYPNLRTYKPIFLISKHLPPSLSSSQLQLMASTGEKGLFIKIINQMESCTKLHWKKTRKQC